MITYQKMFNVYPMLQKLITMELPVKVSYQLYKVGKKIEDEKNFFVQEEKKLIEKYHGEVDAVGKINFEDDKNKESFIKEYQELNNLEIKDLDSLPIKINIEDLNIKLSALEISVLDGVIDFD